MWLSSIEIHLYFICMYFVFFACISASGAAEIQPRLWGDIWTAGGANSNAGPAQISQWLHASNSHHGVRGKEGSVATCDRGEPEQSLTSPDHMQGDICELGHVLMQGSFNVWISHKRGPTRVKELARFKPMQRHLFLYERALLLCKRREEHGDSCDKAPSYSFKNCLKVGGGLH